MPHQPMRRGEKHDDVKEWQRDAEDLSVKQRLQLIGRVEHRCPLVEHEGNAAIRAERRESGDERGNAQVSGDETIHAAENRASRQRQNDGAPELHAPEFQHAGEQHRQQRDASIPD